MNNHDRIEISLRTLAQSCVRKSLQSERILEKKPEYLVEGGPMTWEIAIHSNICPKKCYRILKKKLVEGQATQKGGNGHSRWWPAHHSIPWQPTILPAPTAEITHS